MEWFTLMGHYLQGPIAAALVVGLFWAALAHPERIRSPIEFRLSALCLGLSVIANLLAPLVALFLLPDDGRANRRERIGEWMYLSAIPPVLLVLALFLGLDSVTAKRPRSDARP
jgi:hypothetical protein